MSRPAELDHPKIRPLTREIALSLGLDRTFVDFLFAASRPRCFRYRVESVEQSWTCFVPEYVEVAYPLWSTNADDTLLCIGNGKPSFVAAYHDAPETYFIANTVEGLLFRLFCSLYEDELTLDELRAAAAACGFHHLDEVISFEAGSPREGNSYDREQARIIAEIDRANPPHR